LHRAGLSPRRAAASLACNDGTPSARATRLARVIGEVLKEAVAVGGSSLRDHRKTDGALGYFQHSFRVYGRAGQRCARCGGDVRRITQAGRATFYCTGCQR
jgi:formamidopyrimidine-DNA glycosylase